ncbi:MAG TPA: hypothetical protein VNY74_14145 [Edaphobacter sp.]|nr:hypothetical protein [Edaphobacter sp.]
MGFAALLNLEGKDLAAFVVAGLLGYFSASLVPDGTWAVLTSILVSYHLFLAWLVITAEDKAGVSLPLLSTIATHLACLVLIVPPAFVGHYIPFFGILRYGIAGLAIFERGWLFTENKVRYNSEKPPATPIITDTAEDYQEWLNYLAKQNPASRKLGSSLKEEYGRWLLARAQNQPAASSNDSHPAGG